MGPKGYSRLRRREAKLLARHLRENCLITYVNSIECKGDGVMIVTVEINYNHKTWFGTGGAKCNITDAWNEDIGVQIATGRALLRIAYQILREKDREADKRVENFLENGLGDLPSIIAAVAKEIEEQRLVVAKSNKTAEITKANIPGTKIFRGDDEYYGIKPEKPIDAIAKMRELGMMPSEPTAEINKYGAEEDEEL